MEPLSRSFREALKREHPDLTDDIIDLSEELLGERFTINPEKEPERIKEIDRRRGELMRNRMPRYEEVLQRMTEQESKEQ
jgi:predicted RNase H-like nuclease